MSELAKPSSIKDLINSDAARNQIARVLPKHLTPDRFLRVATTCLLRSPALAQCRQESLMRALLDCSSLGLEPDGRRAHLVPIDGEVQLIVDWKGLVELAKRSGEVRVWRPQEVCANDEFSWRNGRVEHCIDFSTDRGAPYLVYSYVLTKDGDEDTEAMLLQDIIAIRDRSPAYKRAVREKKKNPWISDFLEMAKKTVIRRHSKRLTLSPEFLDALEKDGDQIDDRFLSAKPVAPASSNPFLPADPPKNSTEAPEDTDWLQEVRRRAGAWLMPEEEVLSILTRLKKVTEKTKQLEQVPAEILREIVQDWQTFIDAREIEPGKS